MDTIINLPSVECQSLGSQTRILLVPRTLRTSRWLDEAAAALATAAWQTDPRFLVSETEVRDKLESAPRLVVAVSGSRVVGFISASRTLNMQRTGLGACYINGTIVSPAEIGKGLYTRMLEELGPRTDLEILHSQNPAMLKATGRGRAACFPDSLWRFELDPDLVADLREFVPRVRERPDFCPRTGIVPGLYGRCLYGTWPLKNRGAGLSFQTLDHTSGILVLSFATEQVACIAQQATTIGRVA